MKKSKKKPVPLVSRKEAERIIRSQPKTTRAQKVKQIRASLGSK